MAFQSAVCMETTQYANSEQPKFFAEPTTDFFGMQSILIGSQVTLPVSSSSGRQPIPRPHVIESLERSLAEHGDIWAELARY